MKNSKFARQYLLQEVVEELAPLGWATHGLWHHEETKRIVQVARSGAARDEVDELVTDLWHNESAIWLKNVATPLRRFGRNASHEFQRRTFQRANLVDEALKCHFAGHYAASILLTYAQIDGLTRDITGESFFSDASNDAYVNDATLAGIENNLPTVRAFFNEPIPTTGFHGKLSRHGAAHGRDLTYGNRIISTKALVLLGALIEYLEERATKAARATQRKHESQTRGLLGVDQAGKLLDHRHFDQLYFFMADLDGHIFMDALTGGQDRQGWLPKAHELMKNSGLSRNHFRWCGVDASSYWWFYKTPSGQYMGSAAKLYDRQRPPDWRQWLWDSETEPLAPPWETDGWSTYDGNYATPNWTIDPFPSVDFSQSDWVIEDHIF